MKEIFLRRGDGNRLTFMDTPQQRRIQGGVLGVKTSPLLGNFFQFARVFKKKSPKKPLPRKYSGYASARKKQIVKTCASVTSVEVVILQCSSLSQHNSVGFEL